MLSGEMETNPSYDTRQTNSVQGRQVDPVDGFNEVLTINIWWK
jgi:hypothetical protein